MVLGQIGPKLWFPWQQKTPIDLEWENNVSTFSLLFLVRLFSNLQVTRIGVKSGISMNFSQIGPLPMELGTLRV